MPNSAMRSQLTAASATSCPASAARSAPASSLPRDDEHCADSHRQPGRLHALRDRVRASAGAVQPGGARGGAVGQEGQLSGDLREHDRRRLTARPAASAPRWPTTAVSTSRYSGSAASTPSAGTASPSIWRSGVAWILPVRCENMFGP